MDGRAALFRACWQGAPKRPATAFVMFSNQHRQEVKDANPQLTMVEIAKKLGEMWRGMEQDVRKEWEEKATSAKDHYMVGLARAFSRDPRGVAAAFGPGRAPWASGWIFRVLAVATHGAAVCSHGPCAG